MQPNVKPLTSQKLVALRETQTPEIGNKLALALELADASQADLMRATDLSRQYISDVACGRYPNITIDNAWKFAQFFGCDPGDLFPAREAIAS